MKRLLSTLIASVLLTFGGTAAARPCMQPVADSSAAPRGQCEPKSPPPPAPRSNAKRSPPKVSPLRPPLEYSV